MNKMDFLRQSGIVDPRRLSDMRVHIIGVGGIGSFVSFSLSKMGIRHITVYDTDRVSLHNIPNSFYRHSDKRRLKTEAIRELCSDFGAADVEIVSQKFTDQDVSGIVISCVDSIEVRQQLWENCIRNNKKISLYIDARMGGEVIRSYFVRPDNSSDQEFYESTLYPEKVKKLTCHARAIVYDVEMLASFITKEIQKFATDQKLELELAFDFRDMRYIKTPRY